MRKRILTVIVLLLGIAAGYAAGQSRSRAQTDKDYAEIAALPGPARQEVLALASVLGRHPELALDFTHLDVPQFCLNESAHMLHFATEPHSPVPFAFIHPAAELVAAGVDVAKLPVEPETLGELQPGTWYYYPASGRIEPLHGKPLGVPMLIWTSNSDPKPITWPG